MTDEEEERPSEEVKGRSGLTRESFEALLARLDPDRDKAGELYETIRRKLSRLFEWRGCAHPEELADETINRAARRLAEGVEVWARGPYGYFFGVAHLVYKEVLRRTAREQKALELEGAVAAPAAPEAPSPRLLCLQSCLEELQPEQRHVVLRYHDEENHIAARKELARELDIPMNALRIRVHRICRKLEDCVEKCLQELSTRPPL